MPHLDEALTALRQQSADRAAWIKRSKLRPRAALSRHPGLYGERFPQVWLWHA